MDIQEIDNLLQDANMDGDEDIYEALADSGMLYDLMNM